MNIVNKNIEENPITPTMIKSFFENFLMPSRYLIINGEARLLQKSFLTMNLYIQEMLLLLFYDRCPVAVDGYSQRKLEVS
jgi:hypothetical protein